MAPPTSREYVPRALREAMKAVRLANANEHALGTSSFRYIITNHIHEALEVDREIHILDSLDGEVIGVAELLERLPEDLRKLVFYG